MTQYTEEQLQAMDIADLDRLAWGYASGDLVEIKATQIKIKYPGDMEFAQATFDDGGMPWVRSVDLSEPVDVSINAEGVLELEDGHHRYLAALKLGKKLICNIECKGRPISFILERQAKRMAPKSDVSLG